MNKTKQRSWLLVPASKPPLIADAARSGADVIVLDLVELVHKKDRDAARTNFKSSLTQLQSSGSEVYAQIDPAVSEQDLQACVWPGLTGIVVSRAESAEKIRQIATLLDGLEKERGLAAGTLKIVPAVETAPGNLHAYDIASASQRVVAITLGRADLAMDLRPEPSGEIHLMQYLMQRLIVVAGAAGVTPLGAWWRKPDRGLLATPDNTHAAAKRGRAIGFKGAMCLRADQVDALNRAYG